MYTHSNQVANLATESTLQHTYRYAKSTELHSLFTTYGTDSKTAIHQCQMLLPEIKRRGLYRKKGFSSVYEYAAKIAGMSRYSVDIALWVVRKIQDKPELLSIVEQHGVHAVRPIANLATVEDQSFWAAKVHSMTKSALEAFAKEYRAKNGMGQSYLESISEEKGLMNSGVPKKKYLTPKGKIRRDLYERLMKLDGFEDKLEAFLNEEEAKLVEEMEQEKPEPVRTESRHIPNKIKRYVVKRANGHCEFSDCIKPYEILHHTQRFALDKVHDPDRIVALCKGHEQLAHLNLISNEIDEARSWRVRRHPDTRSKEYRVDRKVQKYRKAGVYSRSILRESVA